MKRFNQYKSLLPHANGFKAELEHHCKFQVDVLEPWLVRVAIFPGDGFTVDRTWMIAPGGDTPWEGHDRLFRDGFACPKTDSQIRKDAVFLRTDLLQIHVLQDPFHLRIYQKQNQRFTPALVDRQTGAYYRVHQGDAIRHYQDNSEANRHYGLGDKAGPLDRSGSRFRVLQLDAMAYNAETSDPLYKHVPFIMVQNRANDNAIGLLYDCMSEMLFDLGCEHSNYHSRYRYVEAQARELVYYIIAGPRIKDVVRRLAQLTGRPHLQPRWTLGFGFTSMHHADAPNAQEVITAFAERCRLEQIPISAIHFGSGYTTRGENRYVFTWNTEKFPDKAALFTKLKQMGLHTVANIKPALLTDHPDYPQAARNNLFFRRADGSPVVELFWGGEGSNLDFTNPATVAWWKKSTNKAVLDAGFDAVWNDNNETEIWNETAVADGFGISLPAIQTRPLHAFLMTRASYEETARRQPNLRPYTVTRAGLLGIQRYAESWTGDNQTSWHTLKWNLRNGISLGLSGIPIIGHDIGGFAGPKPDAELFIRWMQMMALHPRCLMNSWKPDLENPVNLPWMHPEATGIIRESLHLRYRFLPYLYTLSYLAHLKGDPVIRPLFYDYHDPDCYQEQTCFLVGKDVLAAPIVEPGQTAVSVYLPENEGGWYDFYTGELFAGGAWVTLNAPLNRLPLLTRAGAVLPLATKWNSDQPHNAEQIELTVYSPKNKGRNQSILFYDDGLTWKYRNNEQSLIKCTLQVDLDEISLSVDHCLSQKDFPQLRTRFFGKNNRRIVQSGIPGDTHLGQGS
jgi:alpha-glucosidase